MAKPGGQQSKRPIAQKTTGLAPVTNYDFLFSHLKPGEHPDLETDKKLKTFVDERIKKIKERYPDRQYYEVFYDDNADSESSRYGDEIYFARQAQTKKQLEWQRNFGNLTGTQYANDDGTVNNEASFTDNDKTRNWYVVKDLPALAMNEKLRSGKGHPMAKKVDAMIQEHTVKNPTVVYRGVWLDDADAAAFTEGGTFTDKAFMSTAPDMGTVNHYLDYRKKNGATGIPVVMRINVPAGKGNGANISASLAIGEVLLPRNRQFKITRVEERDGRKYVEMDMINE